MRPGVAHVSVRAGARATRARGAGGDFPLPEGALGRFPLQGQRAASPQVVGGMVVVGELTFGESMRHVFGCRREVVAVVVFWGLCARVVLLGLGHGRCLCIGCGLR